jgi:hypothetical protein
MISRSKYNVSKDSSKRTYNGITFDSEVEMKYYRDVLLPKVESGEILVYELQKPYELQEKFKYNGKTVQSIKYVADFFIIYKDGHEEVIDIKGMADSVAKLKRKMFWYLYPTVDYKWLSYVKKYGGWVEYDELQRLRRNSKKENA